MGQRSRICDDFQAVSAIARTAVHFYALCFQQLVKASARQAHKDASLGQVFTGVISLW